jgi:uncharacterized integral membrane protein
MIRRFGKALVLVPLALIIILFAVANRETVVVSFDPFDATQPAYAARLPLFLLILILVIIGVIIGGTAAWLRQHKWRRAARRLEVENRRLRGELYEARHRAGLEPRAGLPAPREPEPPLIMRPPAA